MLEQALFKYLMDRAHIDDATLAGLLDAAAGAGRGSPMLANWEHPTRRA